VESDRSKALFKRLRYISAEAISGFPSASLILFGSLARGDAGPGSDLDVVAVRPPAVQEDDDAWADALIEWRRQAREVSGCRVDLMDTGEGEVATLLARRDPAVWHDIDAEGVVLAGRAFRDIAGSD